MKFGVAHQAEVKLLSVLVYFIVIYVMGLALDTYRTSITPNLYLSVLLPYFTCESAGLDSGRDCQRLLSDVQRPDVFNAWVAFAFLIEFLPLIVFLFSADFKLFTKLSVIGERKRATH